jgi:pilus assembly protein CpaC
MKEGERMHRTFQKPWVLLGGLVALLLVGLSITPARAQLCSPESRPLLVLLNGTTRLQMSSRKPIKTVVNPKEGILTIRTIERDPTTVLLVGTSPGVTRVELEDADGNRETREVLVQADTEYLTQQLRRTVPASSIQVIPNGTNSVVLTGYVGRAEDINIAQTVAQSVGFTVINGLRLNGVQQVQLDVVIARVRRTKGRDFGFNFIGNANQTIYGSTPGSIINTLSGQFVGQPSPVLQPTGLVGQVINIQPSNSTMFGGIIGNAGGFIGFLQALEREGLAKLLAQPRLVTLSGQPASFLDGGEQAVPVPAGLGQVGVQFEEFGTRLNFLPIVLGNGRIHLEVEPEVSILDAAAGTQIAGAVVPGRATQRVHTTVEMETGQTFVIGGLIQREARANASKVPVLGQVPFLGVLFSTKTMDEVETELVVMVTPHLVDAQSACQVSKVLPGQETRTPDDFELFLEGILEAPRGPRQVFKGNRYVPAHHNGPTADLFPCAGRGDGMHQMPISPAGGGGVGTATGMQPAPAIINGNGAIGINGVNGGNGAHAPVPLPANGTAPPATMPTAINAAPPASNAPPAAANAPVTPSSATQPATGEQPVTPAAEQESPSPAAAAPTAPMPPVEASVAQPGESAPIAIPPLPVPVPENPAAPPPQEGEK